MRTSGASEAGGPPPQGMKTCVSHPWKFKRKTMQMLGLCYRWMGFGRNARPTRESGFGQRDAMACGDCGRQRGGARLIGAKARMLGLSPHWERSVEPGKLRNQDGEMVMLSAQCGWRDSTHNSQDYWHSHDFLFSILVPHLRRGHPNG